MSAGFYPNGVFGGSPVSSGGGNRAPLSQAPSASGDGSNSLALSGGGGAGDSTAGGGRNAFGNIFIGSDQNADMPGVLDNLTSSPLTLAIVAATVLGSVFILRR